MERILRRELLRLAQTVEPMRNNKLQNYIVAGLSSTMLGGGEFGKVRLFHAERNTRDEITPHSHRFDFSCIVLTGMVYNTLYIPRKVADSSEWGVSHINQVCGLNGIEEYQHVREDQPSWWEAVTTQYFPGDLYHMAREEVHSITFWKDTKVLFFEGPELAKTSIMIEPWVDGKLVPTFRTEDWMFEKELKANV